MSSLTWLSRYRGERTQVWHELRQLGSTMNQPALALDAQLVCDEMAHRARQNIDAIIERLQNDGYRFHSNTDRKTPQAPFARPTDRARDHAERLQRARGPVPMTVLSWVRLVGDVSLVGAHPQWAESAAADPLGHWP